MYIYIYNKGLSMEPWETPALILAHFETYRFNTTLCFLFLKK